MNKLVLALVALAVAPVLAADKGQEVKITPVPASKMAEYNAKTGGLVDPPANAKKLVILDARAEHALPVLSNFVNAAEHTIFITCEIRSLVLDGKACPRKAAYDAKAAGAGAVILFYERPGDPSLCVYPEDGIALVNCAALASADRNEYSRRFSKEFWRSVGFTLGAYGATVQSAASSFRPVFSLRELDEVRSFTLAPAQIGAIALNKAKLGIYSRNAVPYTRACREGWAPAPTNDTQKAIYKRFRDPFSRFCDDFGSKTK